MKGLPVLLTATIDTGGFASQQKRSDPDIRLNDYRRSLSLWSSAGDVAGIVICENSGADLSALKREAEAFQTQIEFLSFEGNNKPDDVHYGYSELGIIDYAILNSSLLKRYPHFIKATGRLYFPRFAELLRTVDCDVDALVDHRWKYPSENGFYLRARTQLMLFRRDFYYRSLFKTRCEMLGHCTHIEEFLAEKLDLAAQANPRIIRRFKIEVPSIGHSGSTGQSYDSLSVQCKSHVRSLTRKIMPSVWI